VPPSRLEGVRVGRADAVRSPVVDPSADPDRIAIDVERRFGQALFGFARRVGLTDEEAEDAVQEVLTRLLGVLRTGTVIDDPRGWVFTALYRIAMDQHRLRRRVNGILQRVSRAVRGSQVDEAEVTRRLSIWFEVDQLPDRQRQVLYLHYKADLAFDEVARVMGVSPAGARAIASRGIAALRNNVHVEEAR
jgi:RNA polymerase sigma factor (sigma-70 family)